MRGGSDWIMVQKARGPSNTNNITPCGSQRNLFRAFNKTSEFVPNTVLGKGWVTPQLAGTEGTMCGR